MNTLAMDLSISYSSWAKPWDRINPYTLADNTYKRLLVLSNTIFRDVCHISNMLESLAFSISCYSYNTISKVVVYMS